MDIFRRTQTRTMSKQLGTYFVILAYLKTSDIYYLQQVSRRFYKKIIPYVTSQMPTKISKGYKEKFLYHFENGYLIQMDINQLVKATINMIEHPTWKNLRPMNYDEECIPNGLCDNIS